MTACRLALGTAQFGLDYGISNTQGQVAPAEVAQILARAAEAGIDTLDTAYAYGNSEQVLGEALEKLVTPFRLVTKFPVEAALATPQAVWAESRHRLRGYPVYGYLLHNYHSFQERLELLDFLQGLKARGEVQRTGFSVYHPQELEEILANRLPFELIQLPYSVFDQRFAPYFPQLQQMGVEIHIRSALLQGLVFCAAATLPSQFAAVLPRLTRLQEIARQAGLPVSVLCLGFALANPLIERVVVGVQSLANLDDNLHVLDLAEQLQPWLPELAELRLEDEGILNPSLWKSP